MKKSLILLGMLSIGYAYAQEGNVGINTENPKATLEVLPNSANLTKTTNEGIIAPKLTKARIAGIADANLVEGTLVYATDATYTGANTKVAKIDEKGYYFYNGTEWVKTKNEAVSAAAASKWTNDNANSLVKLTNLSNGTTVRSGLSQFIIKNNGSVGMGTDKPFGKLHLVSTGTDTNDVVFEDYSMTNNAQAPTTIIFNKNRGTMDEPLAIQKGEPVGNIVFNSRFGDKNIFGLYDPSKRIAEFGVNYTGDGTTIDGEYYFSIAGIHKMILNSRGIRVVGNATFTELPTNVGAATDKVVVVDNTGALKSVDRSTIAPANTTATNGVQNVASMECNATNRGKMNFIQGADGKSDVFGICMKNADGNYYWGYMVGGNNPTNGTGAFGSGL